MAGDTKERICEAALRLFNERGYTDVSLRDIAREAGVAIGSLTYHFARKEDLLIKMLSDLHTVFEGRFDRSAGGTNRLACMLDLFSMAQANQENYPFYFRNVDAIVRDSESLRCENVNFERALVSYYAESLAELQKAGIISLGYTSPQLLASSLVTLHSSWSAIMSPAANGILQNTRVDEALAGILSLTLRPRYAEAFASLCSERNIAIYR